MFFRFNNSLEAALEAENEYYEKCERYSFGQKQMAVTALHICIGLISISWLFKPYFRFGLFVPSRLIGPKAGLRSEIMALEESGSAENVLRLQREDPDSKLLIISF